MKVGIWIRVSTNEQVITESPETHRQRAVDFCKGRGWSVEEVYDLSGVSGKSVLDHPEAKRMMRDIETKKIRGLVFSKLARLARNAKDLLEISEYFNRFNAALVSIGEDLIDTSTPSGRMLYGLIAVLAEWEREEISARVAASVPIRAGMGKPIGGRGPFGYKWVDKKLVVHEEEAIVARRAFELFNEKQKLLPTCKQLNEEGFRARKSPWRNTTLKRLLTDTVCIGKKRANYCTNRGESKSWVLKPETEWVIQDVDPIISIETWEKTQLILAGRPITYQSSVPKEGKYLYSGLLVCGNCGGKMYVSAYKGMTQPRYICKKCKTKINEDVITEYFKIGLERITMVDPDRTPQDDMVIAEKTERLQLLNKNLRTQQGKIDQLFEMRYSGIVDDRGFQDRYEPLRIRRDQITDEIPIITEEIATAENIKKNRVHLVKEAKRLSDLWGFLREDEKGRVAKDLIQKVVIEGDFLNFTFYYLPELEEIGNSAQTLTGS
ncbi:hypothetical protein GMLC_21600 [Geomonas limicola]|uniref:Integrase n=1 Tax=Geomonas limicola TaxID=2740186 RepID=A0A6V8N7V0_9BACT|nr:recombinase family protein [Geomonas limicola]GFO68581.1 hypothetical protein GMLC_21600 [Geomonas limicola]